MVAVGLAIGSRSPKNQQSSLNNNNIVECHNNNGRNNKTEQKNKVKFKSKFTKQIWNSQMQNCMVNFYIILIYQKS